MLFLAGCGRGGGEDDAAGGSPGTNPAQVAAAEAEAAAQDARDTESGARVFALARESNDVPDSAAGEGSTAGSGLSGPDLPPLGFRLADVLPAADHSIGLLAPADSVEAELAQRFVRAVSAVLGGRPDTDISALVTPESRSYLQGVLGAGPPLSGELQARVGEFRRNDGGRSRAALVLRTDLPSEAQGEIVLRRVEGALLVEDLLIDLSELAEIREPSALEPRGYNWYFQTP